MFHQTRVETFIPSAYLLLELCVRGPSQILCCALVSTLCGSTPTLSVALSATRVETFIPSAYALLEICARGLSSILCSALVNTLRSSTQTFFLPAFLVLTTTWAGTNNQQTIILYACKSPKLRKCSQNQTSHSALVNTLCGSTQTFSSPALIPAASSYYKNDAS